MRIAAILSLMKAIVMLPDDCYHQNLTLTAFSGEHPAIDGTILCIKRVVWDRKENKGI